jgi:type II secretory ATPase GspE/PulE/Tfp pilus assembly ATPase PilB-like protein
VVRVRQGGVLKEVARLAEASTSFAVNMTVAREPMQRIRARAPKEGVYPLRWDGVEKAASGLATLEDVLNGL